MIDDRPAPAKVNRCDKPMKIAFVYCRNPLPMRRADQITVANLLEFLSARGHEVDLFCFKEDAQGSTDNMLSATDIDWLEARCANLTYVERSKLRAVVGALAALLRFKPLQIGWLTSMRLARALANAIGEKDYDVIYVYYFRSAETVVRARRLVARAGGPKVPAVLAMQLSQTLNTRRISDNATSIASKLLFLLESKLVSRYEARIWRKFEKTALIGPKDVEAIASECRRQGLPPIDNWFYCPHGTDIERFSPRSGVEPSPCTVLFAGTLFYPPNIQAAVWLAKTIWPIVQSELPEARLQIVGRDPAPEVSELASDAEGIDVIPNVPDLSEYMLRAAVCVNPVRAAGGMQNKLIEYLASGRPVVATSVANEGICAPSDVLKLADTPEDFAEAIISLLRDSAKSEQMAERARNFAQREWSWEAHWLKLEGNLSTLARGNAEIG